MHLARPLLVAALFVASCTSLEQPVPQTTATLDAAAVLPQTIPRAPQNVLVLGDSQISFGAGAAYTAFFNDIAQKCQDFSPTRTRAKAAAIGVRSSALQHWTARSGNAKDTVCAVDKKYGVNAGAYGVTSPGRSYVQIGKDPNYPFCKADQSPLQAVFNAPTYDPDLVVLSFAGNAADRWQSPANAAADWQAALAQLPPALPCMMMTTLPAYNAETNALRIRAQTNIARAVQADDRCAFVPGLTAQTIRAIQGNSDYFRTNDAGEVIDTSHPNTASAKRFFDLQTPAMCTALRRILTQD